MKKVIVIAGNSLIALWAAKMLDESLANQIAFEVIFISDNANVAISPVIDTVLGKKDRFIKPAGLKYVKIMQGGIKSINFRENRIMTESAKIEYDCLLLDMKPYYTQARLESIKSSLSHHLSMTKSKIKTSQPTGLGLYVAGRTGESYQTALAIARDLSMIGGKTYSQSYVAADTPKEQTLYNYLKTNGIGFDKKVFQKLDVHLTINPTESIVTGEALKATRKDRSGCPIYDAFGNVKDCEGAYIYSGDEAYLENSVYTSREIARYYVNNILSDLYHDRGKDMVKRQNRLLLSGKQNHYYQSGATKSGIVKTYLALWLDNFISGQLAK